VVVEVKALTPDGEDPLFPAIHIKRDVELRLQQSGINVIDREAIKRAMDNKSIDSLYGAVDGVVFVMGCRVTTHREHKMFVYTLELHLVQQVLLAKNPRCQFSAVTWQSENSVDPDTLRYTGGASQLRDAFHTNNRSVVRDLLDGFINDWMKANSAASPIPAQQDGANRFPQPSPN